MKKLVSIIFAFGLFFGSPRLARAANNLPWWPVQSVDTMKYSRDTAAAKLHDQSFDAVIASQMENIAAVGATHVAVGTPYDPEFVPFLRRWVQAARKVGLHVWFRGNFAGWEGWFGYSSIDRSEHESKLARFISDNSDLFEDGDIFSACPECENGGPGDPRQTGDIEGHRRFLIAEYRLSKELFSRINKNLVVNFNSMNADVAREVMDRQTTSDLGGLVVIDHYVATPQKLIADIRQIARESGGKVFLGETGVPIPDINGKMTETEQASWLREGLGQLRAEKELIGLNYWVGVGGSTALWNDDGSPRQAVGVLKSFFIPPAVTGRVVDDMGNPVVGAIVSDSARSTTAKPDGSFQLPFFGITDNLSVTAAGFSDKKFAASAASEVTVSLSRQKEDFWVVLGRFLRRLFWLG